MAAWRCHRPVPWPWIDILASLPRRCHECQVVELFGRKDGCAMNIRSYFGKNRRAWSLSSDGGETWSDAKHTAELIGPVCQDLQHFCAIRPLGHPNGRIGRT